MVYREERESCLIISQPAHALLAGLLAQSWGNAQFPAGTPTIQLGMAAKIHDIGWQEWESAPAYNPETHRPYAFDEMPDETHLAIWIESSRIATTFHRYIGLLVSLHHSGLYSLYSEKRSVPTASMLEFRSQLEQMQHRLLKSLRIDPITAPWCEENVLRHNQGIIRTCDALSLFCCMNRDSLRTIAAAPGRAGETPLFLDPPSAGGEPCLVKPWPFRESKLELMIEARRIEKSYPTEEAMRAGLAKAPWVHLRICLAPHE